MWKLTRGMWEHTPTPPCSHTHAPCVRRVTFPKSQRPPPRRCIGQLHAALSLVRVPNRAHVPAAKPGSRSDSPVACSQPLCLNEQCSDLQVKITRPNLDRFPLFVAAHPQVIRHKHPAVFGLPIWIFSREIRCSIPSWGARFFSVLRCRWRRCLPEKFCSCPVIGSTSSTLHLVGAHANAR